MVLPVQGPSLRSADEPLLLASDTDKEGMRVGGLTGRAQVRSAVAADDQVLFLSRRTVAGEDKFPVVVPGG